MTTEDLIRELRPLMFTFTLASKDNRKGADTRAFIAKQKIDTLVKRYVRENGLLTEQEKEFAKFLGTAQEG